MASTPHDCHHLCRRGSPCNTDYRSHSTALTHTDIGKAVLQPVVSPGCYGNGPIFTIIEGLWKTQPPPHLKNGQYACLVTYLILVSESSVVPGVVPFHMAAKHGNWHCTELHCRFGSGWSLLHVLCLHKQPHLLLPFSC